MGGGRCPVYVFTRVPAVEPGSDFRRVRSSLDERSPVLAQRFESLKLVVIEFGQIAGRTVVKELEEIVRGFAPRRVDMTLFEEPHQGLQDCPEDAGSLP